MRDLPSYRLWAGVALYAAIGAIGFLVLTTQPDISTDGYGTAVAAAATPR